MKKKLKIVTGLILTSALFGCGGGGGSGNLSGETVSGTVSASKVAGVRVCVNDCNSGNCAVTDSNGTFRLTVNSLPVTLKVCVGDTPLGSVNATSTVVSVNPLTLANGNETLAVEVGALIHAMAGDTNGNSTVVNLGDINIQNNNCNDDLVKCLEDNGNLTISITVSQNGTTHKVEAANGTVKCDNSTVHYNALDKMKLWKFEEFVSKNNGKTILYPDGNTCTLLTNPNDISQFKLINCSNSSMNDETWEQIYQLNGQIAVTDEDNNTWIIQSVEPDAGIVCYYPEDNQTDVTCITLKETENEETNSTLYRNLLTLINLANGRKVDFEDSADGNVTCSLITNPEDPKLFMLFNCTNNDWNDSDWEKVKYKDGKVSITDEDNCTALVTSVSLDNGSLSYTRNCNGASSNGTATVLKESLDPSVSRLLELYNILKTLNEEEVVFIENATLSSRQAMKPYDVCTLKLNPENPFELKFVNCIYEDDDENWEKLEIYNGNIGVNDGGNVALLVGFNSTTKEIDYLYTNPDFNNATIFGKLKPLVEPNAKLFVEVKKWIKENNGTLVEFVENRTNVDNCTLIVNLPDATMFKFVNCTYENDTDTNWEDLLFQNSTVITIDEDNATATILKVENNTLHYKYNDNGTEVEGYAQPIIRDE